MSQFSPFVRKVGQQKGSRPPVHVVFGLLGFHGFVENLRAKTRRRSFSPIFYNFRARGLKRKNGCSRHLRVLPGDGGEAGIQHVKYVLYFFYFLSLLFLLFLFLSFYVKSGAAERVATARSRGFWASGVSWVCRKPSCKNP